MPTTNTITSVPLLDLNRQYEPIKEDVMAAMQEVFDSKRFILGPNIDALEQHIARYCNVPYAVGVSSGTDALIMAMMALDIGKGDEVITTPFSFFATGGSIARLGATPVFVDIDPKTYNIDANKIEAAITERTKAIMPVHLFGQCADMETILPLAQAHGLYVIEDAAQAIGATFRYPIDETGQTVFAGQKGTVGCFSFFPSKNLGACGDGGIVTTADPDLYTKMKQMRMHGETSRYKHQFVGGNFRLDALQAAILLVKLPHLDHQHQGRIRNAQFYNDHLHPNIDRPFVMPNRRMIYNQYTIRVDHRDHVIEALKNAQIGHAVYYPLPLHLQECFKYLGYKPGDLPEAEKAAEGVLSIPVFPELTEAELSYVVETFDQLMK